MGKHNQVTPHLARYARHPLPKGEGCFLGLSPTCVPIRNGTVITLRHLTCGMWNSRSVASHP
jgi:hypothetical protein